eukprot:3932050-Rhodomonas_salina.1
MRADKTEHSYQVAFLSFLFAVYTRCADRLREGLEGESCGKSAALRDLCVVWCGVPREGLCVCVCVCGLRCWKEGLCVVFGTDGECEGVARLRRTLWTSRTGGRMHACLRTCGCLRMSEDVRMFMDACGCVDVWMRERMDA